MKGHINRLYPDIQAGSQPGEQAHSQSALAPGLLSAEGQRAAEAAPSRNFMDAQIRAIKEQWSGQYSPGHVGKRQSVHLHHTKVHYGTFIANSKDTFSCGKKRKIMH